jgi:hypothetical protein
MAKGRMVAKEIAIDKNVNGLSDKAALLYTWIIPFLDREGRFFALPEQIKGHVVPYRKNFTLKIVQQCLQEMVSYNLIRIYGENKEYLFCKGFFNHNKPHPNEPQSQIPEYISKLK